MVDGWGILAVKRGRMHGLPGLSVRSVYASRRRQEEELISL
jgi:hypothetical protein